MLLSWKYGTPSGADLLARHHQCTAIPALLRPTLPVRATISARPSLPLTDPPSQYCQVDYPLGSQGLVGTPLMESRPVWHSAVQLCLSSRVKSMVPCSPCSGPTCALQGWPKLCQHSCPGSPKTLLSYGKLGIQRPLPRSWV